MSVQRLWLNCVLLFSLCVVVLWFCICFLFCNAVISVLSSCATISLRKREREGAGCLTLIVFLSSCGCWCPVSLPRGTLVGLHFVIVALPDHIFI